jgi:ArsR family transcriptional regulator, arsenate/arsenite/antimonite-responsive transcriptional repressor
MLNEGEVLAVLTALAQEIRLRIVRTLVTAFPGGVPAGRLAHSVGRAPATLTFHLRILEQAGLVRSHREARSMIYTAMPERLTGLADGLMQGCCGGRPELCRPSYPETDVVGDAPACCRSE